MQCNSDVQLPYRVPICESSYATGHCTENCIEAMDKKEMLEAVQNTQDAQAGYACDYQNKRATQCCNEVKEAVKGHRKICADNADKPVGYIGRRLVARLCSDAYGRGIVRSMQESINLRAYRKDTDVMAAETFRTAQTVAFPGQDLTKWREAIFSNKAGIDVLDNIEVDRRSPAKTIRAIKNVAYLWPSPSTR